VRRGDQIQCDLCERAVLHVDAYEVRGLARMPDDLVQVPAAEVLVDRKTELCQFDRPLQSTFSAWILSSMPVTSRAAFRASSREIGALAEQIERTADTALICIAGDADASSRVSPATKRHAVFRNILKRKAKFLNLPDEERNSKKAAEHDNLPKLV